MQIINKYGGASSSPRATGPSPIVWNNIPLGEIVLTGGGKGFGIFDDFIQKPMTTTTYPGVIVTAATAGTLVDGGVEGGVLVLTPGTSEDNGIQMQWGEGFYIDSDSNIAFGARIALLDADQTDIFAGLAITDTTILGGVTDCIGWKVADGSANLLYQVNKDSGDTSGTDSGEDAADTTYVRLECLVTGESKAEWYVDGVKVATSTSGFPNDEVLCPSLAVLTGEAAANTLSVDWFYAYQWYV